MEATPVEPSITVSYTGRSNNRFGFILPAETGVTWGVKTQGVAIGHADIEGIYFPLPWPVDYDETGEQRDYLRELVQANFDRQPTAVDDVYQPVTEHWEQVMDVLGIQVTFVESPAGQPSNQEGCLWVTVQCADHPLMWVEQFQGKRLALVYPNSD